MGKKKKKKLRFRKEFISFVKMICLAVVAVILIRAPFLISINGEKKISIEAGSQYVDAGATGKLGITPVTSGEVDVTKPGTYKIRYKWFTETATRTVKVVDTTVPVIVADEGKEVYLFVGEKEFVPSAKAIDSVDGDLKEKIKISGKVNSLQTGDYEIIYEVKDSSGNKAELTQTVHVVDKNGDYCGQISNKAGVSAEIAGKIRAFYNLYFTSIKYLKEVNFRELFSNDLAMAKWEAGMDLLLATRQTASLDLRMKDCLYELTISSARQTENGLLVEVYEDDVFGFAFMDKGERAETSDLYNTFTFNTEGKLVSIYKEEGFYLVFDGCETVRAVEEQNKRFLDQLNLNREHDLKIIEQLNSGSLKFETVKKYTLGYDRSKAVEYALEHALKRNGSYSDHNSNCVNFVSQCMHAGGIPMVSSGDYQWKWYSGNYNSGNGKSGYVFSWTYIPSFMTVIENSNKLIVQPGTELYMAEEGDCIMLSRDGDHFNHVVLCTKVVRNEKGEIVDLLYCGNTNDVRNYPLSATVYYNAECEKVLGAN